MIFADRFWRRIIVGAEGECWPIRYRASSQEYGRATMPDGRQRQAHRVAYELAHGVSLPVDVYVCHHCDHPPCCNPAHLFIGSQADNVADKVRKGRQIHGAMVHGAKLSPCTVREIRDAYARGGVTQYELAAQYGVGQTAIKQALRGQTWKSIPGAERRNLLRLAAQRRSPLGGDDVLAIRRRCANGEKQAALAREYRVSPSTVNAIVLGHVWKDTAAA